MKVSNPATRRARHWKLAAALAAAGLLCAPAFLFGQTNAVVPDEPPAANGRPNYVPNNGRDNNGPDNASENNPSENNILPAPGTVNYVEGAVYLDGKPLGRDSVGSAAMAAGQVLETHQGKAEILLDPGIYLRVGDQSAVKMISASITPTKVEILRGKAGVEVDQLFKQNVLQIDTHGITTQLVKTGYYQFDANDGTLKVFSGQAEVEYAPNQWQKVKGKREVALVAGSEQKEAKFTPNPQQDPLMAWSKLRSQYLAEANQQMAPYYYGPGFYPGWYWNPGLWGYTYLGWGPFNSPFGWGFYPPGWGWGWGGWGWGGFYGIGFYRAPHHHYLPDRAGFYGGRGQVRGGGFQGGVRGGAAGSHSARR